MLFSVSGFENILTVSAYIGMICPREMYLLDGGIGGKRLPIELIWVIWVSYV